MCPLWPLHFVFLYLVLFMFTFYAVLGASNILKSNAILNPHEVSLLHMTDTKSIKLTIPEVDFCSAESPPYLSFRSSDAEVVTCSPSEPVSYTHLTLPTIYSV